MLAAANRALHLVRTLYPFQKPLGHLKAMLTPKHNQVMHISIRGNSFFEVTTLAMDNLETAASRALNCNSDTVLRTPENAFNFYVLSFPQS